MQKDETIPTDKSLTISIDLPNTASLQKPCLIKVHLNNNSIRPQLVNTRLSIGYKTSLARELFVTLTKTPSGKNVGIPAKDYDRDFSKPEDYEWLPPGQSIATEFNLFDWYELPGKGSYYISICYQADEKMAYRPKDLTKGTFCSVVTPVTFE